MTTALVLRTCAADGSSYNGFRWPLEVGAVVEAPDWDPKPKCGNGLHGALHGEGDGSLFLWESDAVWMVVEVESDWIVDLIGKVKFPACMIRCVGDRKTATDYIMAHDPAARAVIGAMVSGGDGATVSGGDRATVSGGYGATVSGGNSATVSGGDGATVSGWDGATVSGGYGATVSGGYGATVSGGNRATVSGGNSATVSGGDGATVSGGDGATVSGGYGATVSGGNSATVSGGYEATVSGGNSATVRGGDGATVRGGVGAILQIKWHDGNRYRIATAYVGENDILPNVPYRLDSDGNFVRADK